MSAESTKKESLAKEVEGLLALERFQEAEQTCNRALENSPEDPRLLSALGRALHGQGRFAEAAKYLARASSSAPDHAGIFNDLGRALNNLRRPEDAEAAFLKALAIDPERADIHNNLGHVYRGCGKLSLAVERFVEALRVDPALSAAHNNLGTTYLLMRRPLEAARSFRKACELEPQNPRSLANLGLALQTGGRLREAREAYAGALELQPEDADTWLALGLVHNEERATDQAEKAFRKAVSLRPDDPRAYAELAALYEDVNRLDDAGETVQEGLQRSPHDPRINLEAAKLARRDGDPESAIIRLETFDLQRMDDRLAQMFAYELGLNKDRVGAAEAAFGYFREANLHAQKNERLHDVDAARFRAKIDRMHAFFEGRDPRAWNTPPPATDAESPVFLFGFPRSGTTLTDLLLDNHPGIVTLEEKPTIEKLVMLLQQHEKGYPDALEALSGDDIVALRKAYFAEVERYLGRDPATTVVDKMPIRTINAGLIWRLFPDSRVIFSARHPCDVCISCFMQQFNANDAFANFFTIEDTVLVYDKIMNLWQLLAQKLPLDLHLVRYEDLVTDLEGQSRGLMAFLGKAWQPEVMDYRKRALERGRIATNSYHQVTEPLYTRAMGRWQRYARYLEPHMDTLRPHIRYFGYPEA